MQYQSRKFRALLWTVCAVAVLAAGSSAQHAQSSPTRSVTLPRSSPVLTAPAQDPLEFQEARTAEVSAYLAGIQHADEERAAEAAARERAEREAQTPSPPRTPPSLPQSSDLSCQNPVVPEAIARRESGCRWDAYNAGGCSGRGCLGFYQLDAGHFAAVSPWNSNVSGICYGLDPSTREGQTECASRLGPDAWK